MPGVKRERDDSVGVLTLDEPATLNAMTPDLLGDLATAIGEITADPRGEGAGTDRAPAAASARARTSRPRRSSATTSPPA